MKRLFLFFMVCSAGTGIAQPSYKETINDYRTHYKNEFITDERSPLKKEDTAFLRFYPVNEKYRVLARLRLTPDSKPYDMPTASGKTKKYRQYGVLTFNINDTIVSLQVLQSQKLMKAPKYRDHLFVPFTDGTTYTETYGGGRYLDLSITDIQNNTIELDFNKCYNPWCAFASGYSCPIPPIENRLPVSIKAGELNFGKETEH